MPGRHLSNGNAVKGCHRECSPQVIDCKGQLSYAGYISKGQEGTDNLWCATKNVNTICQLDYWIGVPVDGAAVSVIELREAVACQTVLVVLDPKCRIPMLDVTGSAQE